jgi:hypothetical protein
VTNERVTHECGVCAGWKGYPNSGWTFRCPVHGAEVWRIARLMGQKTRIAENAWNAHPLPPAITAVDPGATVTQESTTRKLPDLELTGGGGMPVYANPIYRRPTNPMTCDELRQMPKCKCGCWDGITDADDVAYDATEAAK